MSAPGTIPSWIGTEARDRDGRHVGRIADLEFDAVTARPSAVVVTLDDASRARVPAAGMRRRADHVALAMPASRLAA